MLSYNLKNIQKVYLGSLEVNKLFVGGSEIFSSIQGDPYSEYVTLLAHFNTDFSDSSTNNLVLSAFNDTFITPAITKYGAGSVFLDGSSDYIKIENNEAFGFGTGDFTIELWVFPSGLIFGDFNPIIDLRTGPGSNGVVITINFGRNIVVVNPAGTPSSFTSINSLINEQWNHLAVQRRNSVWEIYINGILDSSTATGSNNLESSRPCFIGTFNDFGVNSRFFRGYLDDLRITKGIARYTGNFTPPTQQLPAPSDPYIENVSLLLHMDGLSGSQTFIDSSTNNFTLTAFGNAQIDTSIKKFGSGAAYFNGNGDYISRPSDVAFAFPEDFTIELWHYPTTQGNQCLFNSVPLGSPTTTTQGISLILLENNGYSFSIPSDFSVSTAGSFATLNQWNHVALVKNGNSLILFSSGNQVANFTSSTPITAGGLHIGIAITNQSLLYDTLAAPFSGYIDELRITKGIARYTSNFVPPTAPFANPPTVVVDP